MKLLRAPLLWLMTRPRLAALGLGSLSACALAPLSVKPLALLGIAGLIELTRRTGSARQAILLGWLFGLGHFAIGNTWIATSFTYQANMPALLGWLGVLALAVYLAVYPSLATLGAWLLARRRPAALVPGLAACWIMTEWLRACLFTGFGWNPLGIVLLGSFDASGLAILARWVGTYGLSGLVVLFGGMLHILPGLAARRGNGRGWTVWLPAAALTASGVYAMLAPFGGSHQPQGTLAYSLVQPDVRQQDLDNPRLWEAQFVKAAKLSRPLRPSQTRIVLWPESGVPDYLREGYPRRYYTQTTFAADPRAARLRIGAVIGRDSLLLTGAVDLVIRGGEAEAAHNVITAVDGAGELRGSYAKAHLVPFGEYLPMRGLLEPLGLSRLVPGAIDFRPGPGPRTLDLGRWGNAGMLICYEIVFSGETVDRAHRPDYIFNPSNDGWFGSWGPPQHLAQARLRAIEEGLPVLRATTTGISAVIDADGVVRQFIPHHQAGRLEGLIPPAHPPTLFARFGNLLPLSFAALLLALSLVASRRRKG